MHYIMYFPPLIQDSLCTPDFPRCVLRHSSHCELPSVSLSLSQDNTLAAWRVREMKALCVCAYFHSWCKPLAWVCEGFQACKCTEAPIRRFENSRLSLPFVSRVLHSALRPAAVQQPDLVGTSSGCDHLVADAYRDKMVRSEVRHRRKCGDIYSLTPRICRHAAFEPLQKVQVRRAVKALASSGWGVSQS